MSKNNKVISSSKISFFSYIILILLLTIFSVFICSNCTSKKQVIDLEIYNDKNFNIKKNTVWDDQITENEIINYLSNDFELNMNYLEIDNITLPCYENDFYGSISLSSTNQNYYVNSCTIDFTNAIIGSDIMKSFPNNFIGNFNSNIVISAQTIMNRLNSRLPGNLINPSSEDSSDPNYYDPINFLSIEDINTSNKTFTLVNNNGYYIINQTLSYGVSRIIELSDIFGPSPFITTALVSRDTDDTDNYYKNILTTFWPSFIHPEDVSISISDALDSEYKYSFTATANSDSQNYSGSTTIKFFDNTQINVSNTIANSIYSNSASFAINLSDTNIQNFNFTNIISNLLFSGNKKIIFDDSFINTNSKLNYLTPFPIDDLTSFITISQIVNSNDTETQISVDPTLIPDSINVGDSIQFSLTVNTKKSDNPFMWDYQHTDIIDFSCIFIDSTSTQIETIPADNWLDNSWADGKTTSTNSSTGLKIECEGGQYNWSGCGSKLLDTDLQGISASFTDNCKYLQTSFETTNPNSFFAIKNFKTKVYMSDRRFHDTFSIWNNEHNVWINIAQFNSPDEDYFCSFKTIYFVSSKFSLLHEFTGTASSRNMSISYLLINQ